MHIKPKIQILSGLFLLLFALMANAADRTLLGDSLENDPQFSGRYSPTPAIIGGSSISFYGRNFGTSSRRYALKFGSYESISRPIATLSLRSIGSWVDSRITIRMPTEITKEGKYWLRIYDGSRQVSGVTFDVSLPTPTINRYIKSDVCPGQVLSMTGRNFTNIRNAFTILIDSKAPGATRWSGATLRHDAVSSWSNSFIAIKLPTNSAYIKPGHTYRVYLMKRIPGRSAYGKVARGPTATFASRCRDTQGSTTSRGGYYANFRLSRVPARAHVGKDIFIGGFFDVNSPGSLRKFQRSPMRVSWSIRRIADNKFIKMGQLTIRTRRTPFLVRFKPDKPGVYRLYMNSARRDYNLKKPDLGLKAAIYVVAAPVKFRRKTPKSKLLYPLPQRRF